jgi:hypothetical protein
MTDKEKLVELIYNNSPRLVEEEAKILASRLITHGVTVQGWIPVTERLPKNGERVLAHLNSGSTYIADFDNSGVFPDWHKPNSNRLYCYVTHWMPMPQPPKGE